MNSILPDGRVPIHERALIEAHLRASEAVKQELLVRVRGLSAPAFEQLVVRLLLKLRYGCRGEVTGRTGDAGIDGVVYEDQLGFSQIYLQAKRWADPIGRPYVQQFYGALLGRAAAKGVFLTTSRFTKEARAFGANLNPKVVLIDGLELVELMYDCNLGVTLTATYELKRLDDSL